MGLGRGKLCLGFPLPILLVCPLAGALFSNQHSDAEGSSAQTLVTQQWLDCCSARCCEWGYWLCSKPSKYSAASAFLGAFRLGKSGTYFTHQVLHEGSRKQIWLGDLPLGGQEKRRIIFAWGVLLLMDFFFFFYFYFFTALKLCLSQLLKHLDLSAYWLVCFHFNPGLYNWRNFINTVKKKKKTTHWRNVIQLEGPCSSERYIYRFLWQFLLQSSLFAASKYLYCLRTVLSILISLENVLGFFVL